MSRRFASVLITGASGGIGSALARRLAGPGVRLELGGRDGARLAETAAACARAGAEPRVRVVDVTDAEAMRAWVLGADDARPLDLVVANAGISGETGAPGDDPARSAEIYAVNVLGALNAVEPLLPRLRARRAGQVGIVASLAGLRGIARGPAYSGSKAALIVHGEAWRAALQPYGVGVSVACPGYVSTPMTARHAFRMPFLVDAETAAGRIADGLERNRARIVFPWPLVIGAWLLRALPDALARRLIPGPAPAEAAP
jgi:short-subunit dehydrogenase